MTSGAHRPIKTVHGLSATPRTRRLPHNSCYLGQEGADLCQCVCGWRDPRCTIRSGKSLPIMTSLPCGPISPRLKVIHPAHQHLQPPPLAAVLQRVSCPFFFLFPPSGEEEAVMADGRLTSVTGPGPWLTASAARSRGLPGSEVQEKNTKKNIDGFLCGAQRR